MYLFKYNTPSVRNFLGHLTGFIPVSDEWRSYLKKFIYFIICLSACILTDFIYLKYRTTINIGVTREYTLFQSICYFVGWSWIDISLDIPTPVHPISVRNSNYECPFAEGSSCIKFSNSICFVTVIIAYTRCHVSNS